MIVSESGYVRGNIISESEKEKIVKEGEGRVLERFTMTNQD